MYTVSNHGLTVFVLLVLVLVLVFVRNDLVDVVLVVVVFDLGVSLLGKNF